MSSPMRSVDAAAITEAVRAMCVHANRYLPQDVQRCIADGAKRETNPAAIEVFRQLQENIALAEKTGLPLCQDTGLAVVFVEIGQDAHIVGGNLDDAGISGKVGKQRQKPC